jgi:RHS repeat-associated protein
VNGPQGPLQSLNLTRDRAGNLTAVTDPDKRLSAVFSYDAWYRTTGIDLGDEQLSYAFDELDNITSATSSNDKSPAHMGDYQYDSLRPNAVVKAGKLTMSYDAAGNLTQRGGVKLTWDALGRLSEAQLADGKSRYSFGGGADRVIAEEPHGVTHYVSPDFEVQDGLGVIYPRSGNTRVARLVSESLAAKLYPDAVADGKITAGDAFVAGAGAPQDRMLLSGARRLLYEELSQATYFGHDQVGSSTVETDDQGNVTGQRSFFAFGSERASSGDADRYGFTAQESDETGMLHFTYRQLDPLTGRWGSPDPAFGVAAPAAITRLGESTTAYAYVGNNPANFRDLHGLVGELATINRAKKYLTWKKDKAKSGATDAQVERATDVHNKLQAKQWSYASNMSAAVAFLGGVGYSHANNLTGAGLLSMAGFLFSIVNAHMALYEGHSSAVIALREADADEGYQQHLAAEEAAAAAQPGRRALTGNASAYVRALSREPDIERPAAPASSSSSSSSPSSASHPKDDIKRPENDEDWL